MNPTIFAAFHTEPWSLLVLGIMLFTLAAVVRRQPVASAAPPAPAVVTTAAARSAAGLLDATVAA